jgi:hypothetical protein
VLDLSAIAVVDQHAHNLLRPTEAASFSYQSAFTEGTAPGIIERHVAETLSFRRSLREIAAVLDCEPNLAAILAARERIGFDGIAKRFFEAANIEAILLDDGFLPTKVLPVAWHDHLTHAYRMQRIEQLAEDRILEAASWADFRQSFRADLEAIVPQVVALKSIVAYRTGLSIREPDEEAAGVGFHQLRAGIGGRNSVRLACKPLNDWVVWTTLNVAAEAGMPVQFHTGFGDPDLDLREANPLHLRPLLENPAFARVPFVLLHASYPFTREAGFLASVYPNVFVDTGLAVPMLSVNGMVSTIGALLELTAVTKIMFSSDAHLIPELFYLGAKWGRHALAQVLEQTIRDGDLTIDEAVAAAERILRGNATELYGLDRRIR